MSAIIFVEGGGDSGLDARCREGFRKLVQKIVAAGRQPRLVACGPRDDAFKRFCTQLRNPGDFTYLGLWVDSEDPVLTPDRLWAHLQNRDGWEKPPQASDDNILLMATCMETWCVADRDTLQEHYGMALIAGRLPALQNLESRHRRYVQQALAQATENCQNAYEKGKRSFELLGKLAPEKIAEHCPQFVRTRTLLLQRC